MFMSTKPAAVIAGKNKKDGFGEFYLVLVQFACDLQLSVR